MSQSTLFVICRACGATVPCANFCGKCASSLREENIDVLVNQTTQNVPRQLCADALDRAHGDAGIALSLLREGVGRQEYEGQGVGPSAPLPEIHSPPYAPGYMAPAQVIVVQHPEQKWDVVTQSYNRPSFTEACRRSEQSSKLTKCQRMACRLVSWLSVLLAIIAGIVIIVVGVFTGVYIMFTIGGVILAFSAVALIGMICVSCCGLYWCCSCG